MFTRNSQVYGKHDLWLTIDVEELVDTNFNINSKKSQIIDYELLIERWIGLCNTHNYHATCFILGNFAEKYPHLVRKLHESGHEIASHGYDHRLVNRIAFHEWEESISESKKILEDLTGAEVKGYRSASWSLPFEKRYYEAMCKCGYSYSSSYFPMKTYMYGNSIDKKEPFYIYTEYGKILEIPIPKLALPFSGGFYLRVLPLFLLLPMFGTLLKHHHKPVIYIHPYEMLDDSMLSYFHPYYKKNLDYLLAFFSTSKPADKISAILKSLV